MSDNKNAINSTQNKLWTIFSTIFKSIILLLIIGIIMYFASLRGAEIYKKNSIDNYSEGWTFYVYLNPIYGLVGIIIYIAINFFSFLLYNYVANKFKNYKASLGKVIYIIFSIFINILLTFIYYSIFCVLSFENNFLERLDQIIVNSGYITFPITFTTIYIFIYIYRKKIKSKK